MSEINPEAISKLRAIMKENPEVYTMLTGNKKNGRPKGALGKNTLKPGSKVEVIEKQPESYDDIEEVPISLSEAKKLLKANRKPRQYSEETRAKMLENLAKGREKRKLVLEERKKNPVIEAKKKIVDGTVVKKYVVKQRKQNPKPEVEEISEEEDSEEEILKRLTKKQRLMQKLAEMESITKAKPSAAPQSQLRPRQQYSLFYH